MNINEARKKIIGKRSQSKGVHGEALARMALERYGAQQICRIETGWRVKRGPGGKIIGATPIGKVAGDFRAIDRSGKSIMVEVKERDDSFTYSDIEDHQHAALKLHADNCGISLLCIVFAGKGIALIKYPCSRIYPHAPKVLLRDCMFISEQWINLTTNPNEGLFL